ncbi:MAG: putative ABC transport system permease protein [Patiriisocius sp.]|jgi:putative ABC transport system permease protein
MFDRDNWREILQIVVRKPLRAVMASIGVAWGIMMLLIMVGAGNGLENGVTEDMKGIANNSMFMWAQSTTKPYMGFQTGRQYNFRNSDVEFIKASVPEVGTVSPRVQLGGFRGGNNVIYKDKTGAFSVHGDYPDYTIVEPINMIQGRSINEGDISEKRKVCIIGDQVRITLFGDDDCLGEYIQINGINFAVVGVFKPYKTGEDAIEALESITIPFTTFQKSFNYGDIVGWMALLSADGYSVAEMDIAVKKAMRKRLKIHPEDDRAIGSFNLEEVFGMVTMLFTGINILSFFIGFMVLFAGIISIVNIMLITVKERTQEFGIRRAMGATPRIIIAQVMKETLLLTVIAGLIGMIVGVGILELISMLMSNMPADGGGSFKNPGVKLKDVLTALAFMIFFSGLAGLLPAMRAVAIKPVDAIRS